MDSILAQMTGLLVVAMLVALIARRLALPYTVGLVVAGIVIAAGGLKVGPDLTHDVIYLAVLPPLLFEAALSLHWSELRRDMVPLLVLSTLGVAISALVVAGGMTLLTDWPLQAALLFGVLIAATDPVAVIALFRDLGLKGRRVLLVESESLFNDGMAAVLFSLALAWATGPSGKTPDAVTALLSIVAIAGGGVFTGLLAGGVVLLVAGRTSDHLVSAALTTIAAYGAFLLAEHFHYSGVLATVSAGLLIGNVAAGAKRQFFSAQEQDFVTGFWAFAAFIANSFVFLMIGIAVAEAPFQQLGIGALAAAILLVLLGRLLTVYPLCLAFHWSRWRIPLADQHVLWWGGLRGALALALALSLPGDMPFAGEIRIAAFGVAVFSILVQGLTMPLLLRRLARR
jgi:CPA1 family monovalent cation:H+ antiporter